MNKLKKIITCICAFSCVGLSATTFTSCSCSSNDDAYDTEQAKYIGDRTFSIMATDNQTLVFGTGWIVDKPANANQYQYWLATNWHVTHGFEQLHRGWNLYYADKSKAVSEGIIPETSYQRVNSYSIESSNNFLFDQTPATPYYKPAIDLSILKIDFGSPNGAIKDKLDRLNNKKNTDGYINKFVFDNTEIRHKQKYVAGYPAITGSRARGGKWNAKTISASNLMYVPYEQKIIIDTKGHPIGNPNKNQQGAIISGGTESFYYYDVAPQYMAINPYSDGFLGGGSSGSMVITQDFEVCGIYWGIYVDSQGKNAKPSFSLLRTEKKDFLKNYISE